MRNLRRYCTELEVGMGDDTKRVMCSACGGAGSKQVSRLAAVVAAPEEDRTVATALAVWEQATSVPQKFVAGAVEAENGN